MRRDLCKRLRRRGRRRGRLTTNGDDGVGDCDNVYVASSAADGFESCGSPGEVASDPSLGHYYPKRVQEYDKEER